MVRRYRALSALLDRSQVTERDAGRCWPGRAPHPRAAYVKALLVKLCEQKAYVTELRRFLVEHPALVLELGFRPVPAPTQPCGVDVERTVPCARWLRHQQRHLDHGMPRALLAALVPALQAAMPGLGTTVAVDVKHIYAWVRENNPKAYVTERHDAPTGRTCDDPRFRAGTGCVHGINREPGGLMRATLDRRADAFKAIYRQPTSTERINSQATALGIERPKVRNAQSVHRLNTLAYIVINARALQRVRSPNAAYPRPPAQC